MRNKLTPLAQFICAMAEIGPSGGLLKDRSAACDLAVAAGLPRKQVEEAFAQALPFPSCLHEFYIAGGLWGANYIEDRGYFSNVDHEGNEVQSTLGLLVVQDPHWIARHVKPLNLKGVAPDPKTGLLPKWITVKADGWLEESLSRLGVGDSHVNWQLIAPKYRNLFIAGIIDSTMVSIWPPVDEFSSDYPIQNRELVLDAGSYGLAYALCQGIHGATLVELNDSPSYTPSTESWPTGISMTGKSAIWFLKTVCPHLHNSLVKHEKDNLLKYAHPNKDKAFTGVRLTESQDKALVKWISQQSRAHPGREVKTSELVEQSPTLIGRPISRVTAWSILVEFKRQKKLRSRS